MAIPFQIATRTFEGKDEPGALQDAMWDIAFIASDRILPLDARNTAACNFAQRHSTFLEQVHFSADENNLYVGADPVTPGKLKAKLQGHETILIEATTLGCPEILSLLRSAKRAGVKNVSFLYLEPKSYCRTLHSELTGSRNFDLSHNRRFLPVDGFVSRIDAAHPGQAVFFLGYEQARLAQALEQQEGLQSWHKHAVFGVPAFAPGWEADSFVNNVPTIDGRKFSIQYAAAACVESAYKLLDELKGGDKTDAPMVISPLGTKPHAIASSLFLVENNQYAETSLLYDHPERISNRSTDIQRWHLFDVIY